MAAGPQERDRLFTIIEAVLLASVALAAAWSGVAAARLSTAAALDLARGQTELTRSVRADFSHDPALADSLDASSGVLLKAAEADGGSADDYVRDAALLAGVLFLTGISGQVRVHGARVALTTTGCVIFAGTLVLLAVAPKPPL
jgi:hypothetical protein